MAIGNEQLIMTQEGYDQLVEELKELEGERSIQVAEHLRVARSYGDLSENAEYDQAKQEQEDLERRKEEVKSMLKRAVIQADVGTDVVNVGLFVTVKDLEFGDIDEYKLVGSAESDILSGKLSNASPVGAALIGAKIGEVVTAKTPNGEVRYEVLNIAREKAN